MKRKAPLTRFIPTVQERRDEEISNLNLID